MKTSDFDYDLPPGLIAQHPPAERSGARMMVVRRQEGTLEHAKITDLPRFLNPGDLLVLNDTRVVRARVRARKPGTGGKVEVFYLEETAPGVWDALLRASRRPAAGSVLLLEGMAGCTATIESYGAQGRAVVRIAGASTDEVLEHSGDTPLPPYIRRPAGATAEDAERYQTVFARRPGSVAAPTAGLHFTDELLAALAARGVSRAFVTLHVGLGTFRPVDSESVEEHIMEAERYEVPAAAALAVEETIRLGGRAVAVGSTAVRTLETAACDSGRIRASDGRTGLFIRPPFEFRVVGAMLTNFHLPRSTLIMMICALAGRDLMMRAYAEAVLREYRFYSYGDCMLIL